MNHDAAPGSGEWTIRRLLRWTTDYLDRRSVSEPRLAAEVLLSRATECARIDLYARFEEVLGEAQLVRFRDWVRRAARHEPVAYLVEEKEFFSLPFRVTSDVLIPRSESEVLVECALDHCAKAGLVEPKILDLGTGSGCIVVAVLAQCAGAVAVATDISPAALSIARFNAGRNGVLDRLTLTQADMLDLPGDVVPEGGFDILMSNPPYVSADAMDRLDEGVREYEPASALTDGKDGLSFYRSIAAKGSALLQPGGVVVVEVGDGQATVVVETVEGTGKLIHKGTWKDRVVGQERVLAFSPVRGS